MEIQKAVNPAAYAGSDGLLHNLPISDHGVCRAGKIPLEHFPQQMCAVTGGTTTGIVGAFVYDHRSFGLLGQIHSLLRRVHLL